MVCPDDSRAPLPGIPGYFFISASLDKSMTPLALYRRITSFFRHINIILSEISLVFKFREDYIIAGF